MEFIDPGAISILAALIAIVVPGVGSGYAMQKIGELSENILGKNKGKGFFTNALIFSVLAETPTIYGLLIAIIILSQVTKTITLIQSYAFILSALAVAIPGVAAAYSIGLVAQAAIVAIAEKKELFGKTLILAALPEVIAVYGLIVSLLLLMPAGAFGAIKISTMHDVSVLGIAMLIMAISGIIALYIGRVAVNAVKSLLTDATTFTQALIIAVLPESIALYALIIAILTLSQGKYI